MPRDGCFRAPLMPRLLIRIASWVVPGRVRADWVDKWQSGLVNWWILFERGELTRRAYPQVLRHCWGAFGDAFWLRCRREHLRHAIRGPAFTLFAIAALFAGLAALSGGFRGLRAMPEKPRYSNEDRVVSISEPTPAGRNRGVRPYLISKWRRESRLMEDVGAYWIYGPYARITPNVLSILGVPVLEGRPFTESESGAVLVSMLYANGHPGVVGKKIQLQGRWYEVVGVVPTGFPVLSESVYIWSTLPLDRVPRDAQFRIGAVGKLRPGVTIAQARQELARLTPPNLLSGDLEIGIFGGTPSRLGIYGFPLWFALVMGCALIVLSHSSFRGHGFRYWMFFVAKLVSAIALTFLTWVEVLHFVRLHFSPGPMRDFFGGVVVTIAFMLSCGLAMYWCVADQRRRCPVCLQRLAMPVTLGSWGSVLEPATTEMLCEDGHGALSVAETQSSASEPDRWTAMDESWRELFERR